MKNVCFIVNIDRFYHSHRASLGEYLSQYFKIEVIAGDTGFATSYPIKKFSVHSRRPTLLGLYEIIQKVQRLNRNTQLIIITPLMIFICHFLFRRKKSMIYNFSGLGFIRKLSSKQRFLLLLLMRLCPIKGTRTMIFQNLDDLAYFKKVFRSKSNYSFDLIAGSGYTNNNKILYKEATCTLSIGYVGRIRKDKGVLNLISVVDDLRRENFDIELNIWGEIDDANLHGFSNDELHILENSKKYIKGFSSNKFEIFSSFSWFCLPSNGEGLSKSAIEATSFGLPLILSDVEGNRDMIDGNGVLFEYGNESALKEALIRLSKFSNEEVNQMGYRSRNLFEQRWSFEVIAEKWKSLLTITN